MSDTATATATDTTQATTGQTTATTGQTAQASTQTASTAVQSAWYKDWINDKGELNPSALDRLPDNWKALKPTWERFKTTDDLLANFANQQILVGKKALAPLPENAPANVVAERKQLLDNLNGVPPDPKAYGIAKPDDLPDNAWSEPAAQNLMKWAHKHSVSPSAAKELMSAHAEIIKGQLAEQQTYESTFWSDQQKAFEAQIRQENIPVDKASALVEKGAIALGLDLSNEQTKNFMKGADARLMAMRHAIAIGEDHVVTDNSTASAAPDPAAAAADIRSNPANPLHAAYWNRDGKLSRAAHDAAVEKHSELMRQSSAKAGATPGRGRR